MSKSTDTNPRCGDCVNMRKEDGYCGRVGRYVNYFRKACKDLVDRIEAEEEKTLASMPEPEEPDVRVKADAKMRRKAEKKAVTEKTCKNCGRTLPIDQFPAHSKSKDGHDGVCMDCKREAMRRAQQARAKKKDALCGRDGSVPEGMRRCTKCGRVLPVSEFGRNKKHRDGLQYECKDCRNEAGRSLYHKTKGGEERPDRWRQAQPAAPQAIIRPKEVEEIDLKEFHEAFMAAKKEQAMLILSEEELVAELRRRGWTITATKEL